MKNLILCLFVLGAILSSCAPEVLPPQLKMTCSNHAEGKIVLEIADNGSASYYIDFVDAQGKTTERVAAATLPTDLREAGLRISFSYRIVDNSSVAASNYTGGCGGNSHSQGETSVATGTSTDQRDIAICEYELLP